MGGERPVRLLGREQVSAESESVVADQTISRPSRVKRVGGRVAEKVGDSWTVVRTKGRAGRKIKSSEKKKGLD